MFKSKNSNNAHNLFCVADQIVVITGVSGQLGFEYGLCLLERGAKVVGLDMNLSEPIKNLCSQQEENFLFIETDITKKSQIRNALKSCIKKFGVPTGLINNAGLDSPPNSSAAENGPFEKYPERSWDNVLDVNLKGVFLCSQVFGSKMAERGVGSIVNIASIYGLVSPDQSLYSYRRDRGEVFYKPVAYSASKSGVLNLTRYLAVYWAQKGVRVNTLTLAGVANNQDEQFLKAYCERIPIKRMANGNEYNGAVLFLLSNASSYMTGQNLIVDGGWTAI